MLIEKSYMLSEREKVRKYTVKILLFIVCILVFASCGKDDSDNKSVTVNKPINVGFSQLGAESDWRVANTDSIKSSLSRENGFNLLFDDAQQKQDKQIMAIRNFTQQEVDCIVLAPVTETGWDTVLKEAKEAGVPVIVVDRKVDVENDNLFTAWVGSDFRREAEVACKWLESFIEAKGIDGSTLRIVDIQGTLGATAQIGRTDGLADACRENGWKLLDCVPADYTRAKGKEVMQSLLRKYSDINVVYCENDNEAEGAIEAIEEAGKKVGSDIENGEILIISFDAARSGLQLVLEGKIALDVECNPLQGEEVEKLVRQVCAGGRYEKYTYVKESVFSCDDTVKSVITDGEELDITLLTEDILAKREY